MNTTKHYNTSGRVKLSLHKVTTYAGVHHMMSIKCGYFQRNRHVLERLMSLRYRMRPGNKTRKVMSHARTPPPRCSPLRMITCIFQVVFLLNIANQTIHHSKQPIRTRKHTKTYRMIIYIFQVNSLLSITKCIA